MDILEKIETARSECSALAIGKSRTVQHTLIEFRDLFAGCAEEITRLQAVNADSGPHQRLLTALRDRDRAHAQLTTAQGENHQLQLRIDALEVLIQRQARELAERARFDQEVKT